MFSFASLGCGGGGGGGGSVGYNGFSLTAPNGPWGGESAQTVNVSASNLSTINFGTTDALPGGAPAATPIPITWTGFELHFFTDGVETVYTLTPSNPNVSIQNVPTGATVHAYADITLSGGANQTRRAESETITVVKGKNKLTLYIPYYYSIKAADGSPLVSETEYTTKGGINLPKQIGDTSYSGYICSNGTTYTPGTRHDIKGDVTFRAVEATGGTPPTPPMPEPGTITGTVNDEGVLTSVDLSGMTPEGKIVIPAEIDGKPITVLAVDLFKDHPDKLKITEVVINADVTDIGGSAFRDCENLASITLPDTLKSLGTNVFRNCKKITSITLPDSLEIIGTFAFGDSDNLTSVTLSDSLTTIGENAFYFCKKLTSITLPDSLEIIGELAFYCTGITSISIPDKVETLGPETFANCHNLTEINTNKVTYIKANCFTDSENLTTVTMPNVTKFSNLAFDDTENISSLVFGQSTVTVEYSNPGDKITGCKNGLAITVPSSANPTAWNNIASNFEAAGVTVNYAP